MPVAQICLKLKNGGFIYTCKAIEEKEVKLCIDILTKNPNSVLAVTSDENVLFSDIKIKLENGALYEHCFKGIHDQGIILGIDIFEQILKFKSTLEATIKSLNPNANLEMMHLLQDLSTHVLKEDQHNAKLVSLFRNAGSPVNNAVARIESLGTSQLIAKEIKDEKSDLVCTSDICIPSNNVIIDDGANVTSGVASPTTMVATNDAIAIDSNAPFIGFPSIPGSSPTSNVGSPKMQILHTDSRRSSHTSTESEIMPIAITSKLDDIRNSISDVKENLTEIKIQTINSDLKSKIITLMPKHTDALKSSLNEISVELDNLSKDTQAKERMKISPTTKTVYSRALLQTRGIANNTGRVDKKFKPKTQN